MDNTLHFIGRGSAFSKETSNSAYFIRNNTLVLFDIGTDVFKKMLKIGIIPNSRFNNILLFITHIHNDHIGALPSLIEWLMYSPDASNIDNLYIYSTIDSLLEEVIPAYMNHTRLESYLMIYDIEVFDKIRIASKDDVNKLCGYSIRNIPQNHLPNRKSFGYLLKDEESYDSLNKSNRYVYYSGDARTHSPVLRIIEKLGKGDYIELYLECASIHSKVHSSVIDMMTLSEVVQSESLIRGYTYSLNLMHIDDYDNYPYELKSYIVNSCS